MFPSAKILCFYIIILFGLITIALCDCVIDTSSDPASRPSFSKYVGTHKLKINTFGGEALRLHEQQEIEARCHTSFESPANYKWANVLYIICKGGYIHMSAYHFNERDMDYYSRRPLICSILKWNLFESSINFNWCPSNVTSYILARDKSDHSKKSYLAGICYDIYSLSFHSVYYSLGPNKTENEEPLHWADFYHPGTKIEYIRETFGYNSVSGIVFAETQSENWITDFKFDYGSMIQHYQLQNAVNDDFAGLLEFLWWSNLRLYNWKRYIKALEKHVEKDNKIYDILAGVSGSVRAPIIKACQKNYTMEEVVFDTNRKIPLYVWNYLQDRDNRSNEMVIIGFNSPFNEFYSQDDVISCTDRCHEVPWLQEVSSYFRYNIMGRIVCCNVEDVRSSKHLVGFPENDMKQQPVETTEFSYDFNDETTASYDAESEAIETDDDDWM